MNRAGITMDELNKEKSKAIDKAAKKSIFTLRSLLIIFLFLYPSIFATIDHFFQRKD